MTLNVRVPAELVRQAALRGMEVAPFVEHILQEAARSASTLPPSPKLTREELAECLAGLSQFSDQIPDLPDSAFTREAIYADHD